MARRSSRTADRPLWLEDALSGQTYEKRLRYNCTSYLPCADRLRMSCKPTRQQEFYSVVRILDVRNAESEVLVQWAGLDSNGRPYPHSWIPANDLKGMFHMLILMLKLEREAYLQEYRQRTKALDLHQNHLRFCGAPHP